VKKDKPKKKKTALQAAASRKLAAIGGRTVSAEEAAHMLFHMEERNEVERRVLEDGTWAWLMPPQADGRRPMLKPTPELLEHLRRFEAHHQAHE
jgi:nitric oxide synthase oxygenase domain/subunit